MTYDFNSDLDYGKRGERFILNIVRKKYPKAFMSEEKCNWDIYVPEKDIYLEVKTDRESRKTDNVAIECEYKGNPSGIETTISNYWYHIFYDSGWKYGCIKTTNLFSLCERSDPIPSGDGAMCHLVPKNVFKGHLVSLHDIRGSAS